MLTPLFVNLKPLLKPQSPPQHPAPVNAQLVVMRLVGYLRRMPSHLGRYGHGHAAINHGRGQETAKVFGFDLVRPLDRAISNSAFRRRIARFVCIRDNSPRASVMIVLRQTQDERWLDICPVRNDLNHGPQ